MMPARSMSPQRTYSEMMKGFLAGIVLPQLRWSRVSRGSRERRRRSLDHLDTLDYRAPLRLAPILRNEERRQRIRNQRLVRALPVDQPQGQQADRALRLLHILRSRDAIHGVAELET